jgi:hypothetical protein
MLKVKSQKAKQSPRLGGGSRNGGTGKKRKEKSFLF